METSTNSLIPTLGPAQPRSCKICGTEAQVCGWLDFNRHCSEDGKYILLPSNIPVSYNLCPDCGFLFSGAFDEWSHDDFKRAIYNDDYARIDPEFETKRPLANLTWFKNIFGGTRGIDILDYGGGTGMMATLAREAGFSNCFTYDPFVPAFSEFPDKKFDLVSCFETMEHTPQPMKTIEELTGLTKDEGLIFFSTLLVPDDIQKIGLTWWYVAPRNGHISLFSSDSIGRAFGKFGYKVAYFDHNKFVAFRKIPEFAKHIFTTLPRIDAQ